MLQAEYRGFAGNPGKPSEAGLYADGRAALDFLQGEGVPVVIHRCSLGSGIALQLAYERRCAGLILEAPFTSAVAAARLPWLPVRYLAHIDTPLLIYGGRDDRVIPPRQFAQLYEAACPPRQLVELEGAGHVDAWPTGG